MDTAIVFAIIILMLIIYFGKSASEGFADKKSRVPKIIWSYWSDPNLPKVVEMCMQSWRKYNPEYEIRMMNKDNYRDYVKSLPDAVASHPNFNDCPQKKADLIRIYALCEWGGVWIDASILMYEKLDNILP